MLKVILKDLDNLKTQIPDEDRGTFYAKMELLQNRVNKELKSIIDIMEHRPCLLSGGIGSLDDEPEVEIQDDDIQEIMSIHDDNIDLASEVAAKKSLHQNWQGLRMDLTCLNQMFNSLATTVMVRWLKIFIL